MFKPKLIVNKNFNYEPKKLTVPGGLNGYVAVMISVNPVFDWFEENINNISYKLLKAFMTNIVPLGNAGKKYFKVLAHKKVGFTVELWKLYNQLEKMHKEGRLKIKSYLELQQLGYTGVFLFENYPVDDILKLEEREILANSVLFQDGN